MKSIIIEDYGSVDQFKMVEIETPKPMGNDVLVEVAAVAINALDWKIRVGYLKDIMPIKLPAVLGWDISGVVKEIGDQVKNFKIGDDVFARADLFRPGGLSEFITVEEKLLLKKPDSLTFEEIASIPLTGLAAWQSLFDHGEVKKGESVLIHGGSGGVGSMAIQLAKYRGATVTTTTSGKNEEFVRSLGADSVIDYEKEDFANYVGVFDVVLDTLGGKALEKSYDVLKPGGRLVTLVGQLNEEMAKEKNISNSFVSTATKVEQLEQIGKLVSEGVVKTVISNIFPFTLEGVREAHQLIESGHARGKIIVKIK